VLTNQRGAVRRTSPIITPCTAAASSGSSGIQRRIASVFSFTT
jgi:hypothetical protein